MTREQIQEIILRVLGEEKRKELSFEAPVEVSARHVHLTEEAVERLFGVGATLTPKRPLSQPGQYLCEERVTLATARGRIENVAVLGPPRSAIQTELSMTDCRQLGIRAPLRLSGDLEGAADVYIIGPAGIVEARQSVIVAQAHLHITPAEAQERGVTDGQVVSAKISGERPVTLDRVICRVSSQASFAIHIDFDEANGCMLPGNTVASVEGRRTEGRRTEDRRTEGRRTEDGQIEEKMPAKETPSVLFSDKLITERIALQLAEDKNKRIVLQKGVIITPSAKDVLRQSKMDVVWQIGGRAV